MGNFHSFPNHALLAELVRCKRMIMILLVIQIRFLINPDVYNYYYLIESNEIMGGLMVEKQGEQ